MDATTADGVTLPLDRRILRALAVLPGALHVVAAVAAIVVEPGRNYAVMVPLAVAATLWGHVGWRRVARRPVARGAVTGYLVGLWLLDAALILIDPVFVVAAIAGLVAAPMLTLDWRGFPGVFAFSALIHLLPGPPDTPAGWAIIVVVILVQTALLGGAGSVSRWVEEQSEQRRRAVVALEAAAAENARLQDRLLEQAREAGVVAERARVAREIHDTLAQGLVGVLTQIDAARTEPTTPVAADRLGRAADLARTTLNDARRSMHDLLPAPLADGLLDAVRGTVEEWARDTGVPVDLRADPPPPGLSRAAEVALLRGVQEALHNVARHAGASRVVVTLTAMDDAVALDVHDDGSGFDPTAATGFGLAGMRERVASLGGRVEVESTPGDGTAVSVFVPVTGADA